MDVSEEVDFEFFDTPRNDNVRSPKSKKTGDKKPPTPARAHKSKEYGDLSNGKQSGNDNKTVHRDVVKSSKQKSENYFSDDSFSSSESETPRFERTRVQKKNENKKYVDNNMSESSSAYSNSNSSSSDDHYERYSHNDKKKKIDIHLPQSHVEAWGDQETTEVRKGNNSKNQRYTDDEEKNGRRQHRKKSVSESSESDTEQGKHKSRRLSDNVRNNRVKSAKTREGKGKDNGNRKPQKSTSSSYSNNSDITDVSPLDSPEASPRVSRKHIDKAGKENGKYKNVQYVSSSPERDDNQSINLETDQIDLSILMKCMADIDREKHQRLKANSRRVMFAPPAPNDKSKANYTFSMGRAKLIEKENQRLLKQIMMQVNTPGTVKKAPGTAPRPRGPKKAVEPLIQRLTPSAVNRMREQRRIEADNMHILGRLQVVRASAGMARHDQISQSERQMSYGIPSGTIVIPGQRSHYDTMSHRSLHSSMSHTAGSTQGSRPSSAKSNASFVVTPGKKSRPSSAKSNASIRSNASMRSNISKRSNVSVRSNMSFCGVRKMADGRVDKRPEWDDRFSY